MKTPETPEKTPMKTEKKTWKKTKNQCEEDREEYMRLKTLATTMRRIIRRH